MQTEKKSYQRNHYLSLAKGVAIILMLWGHCIQYCNNESFDIFENHVFQFIYSFHMPLFMIISGYLFYYSFSKRNLEELLKHRIQGLLQPIICCSFVNYYLTTGIKATLGSGIKDILSGGGLITFHRFGFFGVRLFL